MAMSSLMFPAYDLIPHQAPPPTGPAGDASLSVASPNPTQGRLDAIAALGLDNPHSVPAFEEAIQLVQAHLGVPLGWVSLALGETEIFKGTYGLSSLGLGHPLVEQRCLPLAESLIAHVLNSRQPWAVTAVDQLPQTRATARMIAYGLAAYCAVPLITSQQQCIGVLAVMDRQPRTFTAQDISFLAMAARWGMGEYERQRATAQDDGQAQTLPLERAAGDAVRLHLLGQIIQDMRNPLTAVLGMTSMLSREIYGPLTEKQREYIGIVHHSSQTLMNQVDDILELGLDPPEVVPLVASPVDVSCLGPQVIDTLAPLAESLSQTLAFTVEPNQGVWMLDQHIVKQVLYHGVFSLMHMASANSILRIHSSRKGQSLALALWVSNPWLGEGIPNAMMRLCQSLERGDGYQRLEADLRNQGLLGNNLTPIALAKYWLGLLRCQHLAQHHGGQIRLQGSDETGYRLVITLPALVEAAP
ncbi:MAG: HAMP domain-containing sensor histidine kinase [Leptolyngbya sp.]|nr:HAMP domain-containing sensor histidine kinase [Leptolyngbya sp.]